MSEMVVTSKHIEKTKKILMELGISALDKELYAAMFVYVLDNVLRDETHNRLING